MKLLSFDKVFDAKSLVAFNIMEERHEARQESSIRPEISHRLGLVEGFGDGSSDVNPVRTQVDAAVKSLCAEQRTLVIMVGRFDRRELSRALVKHVGSNWALAEARAAAVAQPFRLAGCEAVTLAAPPVYAASEATIPQMALDRSVTIHAYVIGPAVGRSSDQEPTKKTIILSKG
jgi:hypothetical protein